MDRFDAQFTAWMAATPPAPPAGAAPPATASASASTDELAHAMLADPDGVTRAFDHIDDLASDQPDRALTHLTGMAGILGRVFELFGGLPERLEHVVKRFRAAAERVAAALRASQVTVQVGFPASVAIALTFPVAPPAPSQHAT